ncbi:hypothetical protein BDW_08975 [Bdellovibrio bacteriovorus W]|nr:hypothetical protein BDW_08975 [Bdellovibrio bacteriovorus W]
MKKTLLLLTLPLLLSSTNAFAQKIKVKRVKGKQAVVEFSGGHLQTGQVYELASDEYSDSSSSGGSRNYVVNLSASLSSTKDDGPSAENVTAIELKTRFGWNLGHIELGPLLTFSSSSQTNGTVSTFSVGGFADYNLLSNAPGEAFLYGVGGHLSIGQHDPGTGAKNDLMNLFAGPFVKWFPGGGNYAFRGDLGFIYQKISTSTAGDITNSGLQSSVGIIAYF